MTSRPLTICLVCSGNRCRSPFAATYLGKRLVALPARVVSVGTLGITGAPVPAELVEIATGMGLDLSTHRSRALRSVDLAASDVVIGMELHHAACATVDGGANLDRSFTLIELVSLLEEITPIESDDPVDRARMCLREAADLRRAGFPIPRSLDIADPFATSRRAEYEAMATTLRSMCDRLVALMFGYRTEHASGSVIRPANS